MSSRSSRSRALSAEAQAEAEEAKAEAEEAAYLAKEAAFAKEAAIKAKAATALLAQLKAENPDIVLDEGLGKHRKTKGGNRPPNEYWMAEQRINNLVQLKKRQSMAQAKAVREWDNMVLQQENMAKQNALVQLQFNKYSSEYQKGLEDLRRN